MGDGIVCNAMRVDHQGWGVVMRKTYSAKRVGRAVASRGVRAALRAPALAALLLLGLSACGPRDPCVHAAPMCIEAGPPEALRAFVVACIGGRAASDETDYRVRNCMEAGYNLHCTRRANVTHPRHGRRQFTESGPQYGRTCPTKPGGSR